LTPYAEQAFLKHLWLKVDPIVNEIFKLFFGKNPDILRDVANASSTRQFHTGSIILGEEDTGCSVYYLLEGKAKTVRYSNEGAEIWLDEIAPGALFGEMAALGAQARTATIVAATNVKVAVFSEQSFRDLITKHGTIGLQVARLLVARVEKTTQRMFELAAVSSKGRVYAELLRQAKPVAGSQTSRIENMPSMSAMAKQLNNTRETVSRTVNELEKDGFIKREGHQLTILMPDALRNLSR
jgi:CRP/FNR family transcriptional regulator, cyclic AMP receptor protein